MSDVYKLYSTTVRSHATVPKNFPFLPPHGRLLQPGEEYTFPGSPATFLAGVENRRRRAAFTKVIEMGLLQVLESPAPQARDTATGATYAIGVTNGNVVVVSAEGSSTGQ